MEDKQLPRSRPVFVLASETPDGAIIPYIVSHDSAMLALFGTFLLAQATGRKRADLSLLDLAVAQAKTLDERIANLAAQRQRREASDAV